MKVPSIVLIEDDPNDQELIRLALAESKLRYELKVFNDGEQALAYFRAFGEEIKVDHALILLDLKLPKLNGLETLKALRKTASSQNLPVVIFTSSREEQDIRECYEQGANAFVRKPIESNDFAYTIKNIGTFWLKLNELPVV